MGAANLALRTAARGADLALGVVRTVLPSFDDGAFAEAEVVSDQSYERPSRPAAEAHASVAEPEIDYDGTPPTPLDETAAAAKTIDDEPELVAEFAEPGAEEGASAELEVDEPWDGYDELTAEEVMARIDESDAAQLTVLELYERAHKNRRTVLTAAERRHRALNNAAR
jgi:hypothetical protein